MATIVSGDNDKTSFLYSMRNMQQAIILAIVTSLVTHIFRHRAWSQIGKIHINLSLLIRLVISFILVFFKISMFLSFFFSLSMIKFHIDMNAILSVQKDPLKFLTGFYIGCIGNLKLRILSRFITDTDQRWATPTRSYS